MVIGDYGAISEDKGRFVGSVPEPERTNSRGYTVIGYR